MSAVSAAEPPTSSVSFRRFPAPAPEHARASASSNSDAPVWCYGVSADPSPGLLPRVLEYVAKRGLVPLTVHASLGVERETQGVAETLSVDLQVAGLDADTATHVGNCLGQIVGVRYVAMSRR